MEIRQDCEKQAEAERRILKRGTEGFTMHLLDLAAIVITGLMVGNELTVSLFIHPVVRKLDEAAQTRALSLFAALLGSRMPFWYVLCLLLLAAETWLRHRQPGFPLLLAATLLWVGVILFTVTVLVPINNRIAALTADSSLEKWLPSHQRWERLHRLRIVLLLAAFVLLVCALL